MARGWHVTAQDIKQWTESNPRQAQETLPLLIRKLIQASVDSSLLRFPAGNSISLPGWDGLLKADEGNAFVPAGTSAWEFGTDQKIKEKADGDYKKRTENSQGIDKKSTMFVFATSRVWTKRDEWVQEKNADGQWAQVKGLNAGDLETWLELCPAVHRWFARLIGKRSDGAWDIEQAWGDWSCATKPECNADLVLAGRENQARTLADKLKAEPSVIRVSGESEEEAYAFALAVVNQYSEFSARLLVVKGSDNWDFLLDSQYPLILIPKFDILPSFGLATNRGHWVILPCSKQPGIRQADIILNKADRNQQISALIAMGLEEKTSKDIVLSSRGYLGPIRRHPKLASADYQQPSWAIFENAEPMIAALLVGEWNVSNKDDCDKVAKLAGIPYNELNMQLDRWSKSSDSPIRLIDNIWQIVSRQDAWSLLSPFINSSGLERFGQAAIEVLQELDPGFELPPKDRWAANLYGKEVKHSAYLRLGLAEMLAMLAAYGDKDCQNTESISIQDRVSWWVRQLLIEDMSEQRWYSLKNVLPLLAEAAPDVFLEAVDKGLQGENPIITGLFIDEGFMGGCPYAGLLWALEGVSWNQDYLARVARILAKLSHLDYSSSYSNQPSGSLTRIFQGWFPQTKASLEKRLKVIDTLIRLEPESGWQLLLDLLPLRHSISTQIHRPKFREWADEWTPGVTLTEYNQHTRAVVERTLGHIDDDPDSRWPEFIKYIPQIPKEYFDVVIAKLKEKKIHNFSDLAASKIRHELREMVYYNREFADAKWALPQETVDQLDEILSLFTPDDPLLIHKFLFDTYRPDLPSLTSCQDREQREELIEEARKDALEEIWRLQKISGIETLASDVEYPWVLGKSLGDSSFTDEIEELVLSWLGSDKGCFDQTAKAYIATRYRQNPDWLEEIVERYKGDWPNEIWVEFCLGLPFNKAIFDFLGTLPEGVTDVYWKNVNRYYLHDDDKEFASWVIEQLLAHKRPFAAVDASSHYLLVGKSALNSDLLARTLEMAVIEPNDHEKITLEGYEVFEILKAIQSASDIDDERLARIEWMYLPIFGHRDIPPSTLIKEVCNNPNLFVHFICLAFKADPLIEDEFSDLSPELKEINIKNSYELLQLMNRLPGQDGQKVDATKLQGWIEQVRQECAKRNRFQIGDTYIGKLLSHSPEGNDGMWPHEAVRDAIERYENLEMERGIEIGRYNQRGVVSKALDEGGKQEHELADKYKQDAEKIRYIWPRTAEMLRRIAKNYEFRGRREDLRMELRR
jgi:hypothetical protein